MMAPAAMPPPAAANAKTMFASSPPPELANYTPPAAPPRVQGGYPPTPSNAPMSGVQMGGGTPGAMTGAPMPMGNPMPMFGGATPAAPIPQYAGSTTPARAGRPIEPWKDALRLMMFLWGGALLVTFLFPVTLDPLVFNWDAIANAEGVKQMLRPLLIGGTGLLAIVFALMPLATPVRGLLALVLGLAGTVVPLLLNDLPAWPILTMTGGFILLIPGLLLRTAYRDSILPRLLVTVGVLLALAIWVVPRDGNMMVVQAFHSIVDSAHLEEKILAGAMLGYVLMLLLALLVWLPAPATGGAKLLMWLFLVWPAFLFGLVLVVIGGERGSDLGSTLAQSPAILLSWIGGSSNTPVSHAALAGLMGIPTAFGVLIGYGGASTLGKSLE
jgi:hypothetical protein